MITSSLRDSNRNDFHLAIPTEYKGIRFRSKSEAIVARGFDLVAPHWLWEYEPKRFGSVDGWVPDFLVVMPKKNSGLSILAVEYKPTDPTDTYVENLGRRFDSILCAGIIACLLVGNPFDTNQKRYSRDYRNGIWYGPFTIVTLCSRWDEAKYYRFDLK